MDDYGLFGPDSVAWRVWGYPTSLTVGFQRSVVVEELDPFLLASVEATNKVRTQARTRYDHTIRYFATVAFADSRSAVKASEMLTKVHARNVGIEPLSGNTYDANNPDSQLWILLTAWHSVLYAYEMFGPGKLSPDDERRYWEDCVTAAELQTCDPDKVPRTRGGIRDYFEAVRPRLAASEATQAMMDHLLNAEVMFPPVPAIFKPGAWIINRSLRAATIATMPRWQRQLADLHQSRLVDSAVVLPMKIAFRLAAASRSYQLRLLAMISPGAVPVVEPMLRRVVPRTQATLSPAEAFERHGVPRPRELYAQIQDRRRPGVDPGPQVDDGQVLA
ncbi:MAG: oxygenase MpaB family protein [Acidimicrobiales bacterium]